MRALTTRSRRPTDIDECVALLRRVHEQDGYPTHWPKDPRRFVAPPYERKAWVADLQGIVVGHVALHHPGQDPACAVAREAAGVAEDRLAAVGRLFTSVEHRRQHGGDRLLEQVTAAAHRNGQRPFLNVVQHLTRAVALYQRHGWTDLGPLTIAFADGTSLETFVFLGPTPS